MDAANLDRIAAALTAQPVIRTHDNEHVAHLPDRTSVGEVCRRLLALLFPGFFSKSHLYCGHLDTFTRQMLLEVEDLLRELVAGARRFHAASTCREPSPTIATEVDQQVRVFIDRLPQVAALVASDVDAAFDNDPAAQTREEIVAAYPGVQAIAVQRLAHQLYRLAVPLVPRMMTEIAHNETGIDLHPGAVIGERFAIDHGTGIVVGETTSIGDSCMLYHGVTLGAFNPLAKNAEGDLVRGADNKRHPDLMDHVTVYPGATILGGGTVVGHHSVIGGNVWLTHSVEPYSLVTIRDPDLVFRSRNRPPAHDFSI